MSQSTATILAKSFSAIAFSGQSASETLGRIKEENVSEVSLIQEVLYGTSRHFYFLNAVLEQLTKKTIAKKHSELRALLLTSLYQIEFLARPNYAIVSEAVEASLELDRSWAKALVNGVLRSYLRDGSDIKEQLNNNVEASTGLPVWLIKRLKNAWPSQFDDIVAQSMRRPPMSLRINKRHPDAKDANQLLEQANLSFTSHLLAREARILETAVKVTSLPKFEEGLFSVQDVSAQLAAELLPVVDGDYVVDACAAPGGKVAHLLERYQIELTALEKEASRSDKIHDNLSRLQLNAEILVVDATQWQADKPIDALLLDVPCSATAVIRRQPDIKLHRRDEDILPLVKLQRALLDNLWPQLKNEGYLLYATCSILPDENHKQIKRFCRDNLDARVIDFPEKLAAEQFVTKFGTQIFPDQLQDGFFYCLLQKQK